jgi:hypothetical protein
MTTILSQIIFDLKTVSKVSLKNWYCLANFSTFLETSPLTECPKSGLDIKNTPSPNPLFFQKISHSAYNEPQTKDFTEGIMRCNVIAFEIHNKSPFKLIRIS